MPPPRLFRIDNMESMGLDIVELVMRTEEVFGVTFADAELVHAETVGALYQILCQELELAPLSDPEAAVGRPCGVGSVLNLKTIAWTPEDVWATLVWVVVDQLQVRADEVHFETRWVQDLGAD